MSFFNNRLRAAVGYLINNSSILIIAAWKVIMRLDIIVLLTLNQSGGVYKMAAEEAKVLRMCLQLLHYSFAHKFGTLAF